MKIFNEVSVKSLSFHKVLRNDLYVIIKSWQNPIPNPFKPNQLFGVLQELCSDFYQHGLYFRKINTN